MRERRRISVEDEWPFVLGMFWAGFLGVGVPVGLFAGSGLLVAVVGFVAALCAAAIAASFLEPS